MTGERTVSKSLFTGSLYTYQHHTLCGSGHACTEPRETLSTNCCEGRGESATASVWRDGKLFWRLCVGGSTLHV